MKLSKLAAFALASILSLPYCFAALQDVQISQIIKGEGIAPYMKIGAIPADYKAVKIELAKGSSEGGMGSLMPLMMMGMSGNSSGNPEQAGGQMMASMMMSSMFGNYWTKAETVKMGGQEFLVTYKLEFGMRKDMAENSSSPIAASLRLALVRTDMIASLSPDPNATMAEVVKFLNEAKIPYDVATEVVEMPDSTAVTAAILFPVFAQAKEAAKVAATLSNSKQLALGMMIYCSDYDDMTPYAQGTAAVKFVTEPYLKNRELWKSLNPAGGEFKFNMALAGVNLADVPNPASTVLFYEPNAWADGRRVVSFADGHAKVVTSTVWKDLEKTLRLKIKKSARPLPKDYGVGK